MIRIARLVLIALLVGAVRPLATVAEFQPPTIEAEQSATVDFPHAVTFHLSAETSAPVNRAELRYFTTGKDYSNAAVVEFAPATSIETEYTVDAQIDYIEPGVDITYQWLLHDDSTLVAQTAEQTFTWTDLSFDWQKRESQDVFLFTYNDDSAFDEYILQVAQESADKYKVAYDIANIDPVRIWVYASQRDFSRTLRQNSESWIGGFSLPEAGVIAVPIEPGDRFSVERVITHEVSHHVLYQATQNPFSYPPTWLDEGLAVTGQLAGNASDLQIVLGALEEGSLPSLRTLSSSFPTDPAAANRSYATSHMAVQFMLDQWGAEAMTSLIQQFRQSATADEALMAVYGLDTETLDRQFRDWLETQ